MATITWASASAAAGWPSPAGRWCPSLSCPGRSSRPRAGQQRHVVVGRGIRDAEVQRHGVQEGRLGQVHPGRAEVGRHLEHQAVAPGLEGLRLQQRPVGAPVVVQHQFADQFRLAGRSQAVEADGHAGGRAAAHRVQHVGRELSHGVQKVVETCEPKCIHFRIHRKTSARSPCPTWPAAPTPRRLPPRRHRGGRSRVHPAPGERTTTDKIVASVTTAIVERRLMPGTKLVEQQIADIFRSRAPWCARPSTSSRATSWSRWNPPAAPSCASPASRRPARSTKAHAAGRRDAARTGRPHHRGPDRPPAPAPGRRGRRHRPHRRERTHRLLSDFHSLLAGMLGNEVLAEMLWTCSRAAR
jgi:hypothetical protein